MPLKPRTKTIVRASLFAVLAVAVVARLFFIEPFRIPQNGMFPGLPAGSWLFTLKRAYAGPVSVKRGDIVVFVTEKDGLRYNYIWRVIGLPGELVEAAGEDLVIDGRPVDRQLVREAEGIRILREKFGDAAYEIAIGEPQELPPDVSVTVPAEHFFVMGDNRYGARDSRYHGTIPYASIIGRKL